MIFVCYFLNFSGFKDCGGDVSGDGWDWGVYWGWGFRVGDF